MNAPNSPRHTPPLIHRLRLEPHVNNIYLGGYRTLVSSHLQRLIYSVAYSHTIIIIIIGRRLNSTKGASQGWHGGRTRRSAPNTLRFGVRLGKHLLGTSHLSGTRGTVRTMSQDSDSLSRAPLILRCLLSTQPFRRERRLEEGRAENASVDSQKPGNAGAHDKSRAAISSISSKSLVLSCLLSVLLRHHPK